MKKLNKIFECIFPIIPVIVTFWLYKPVLKAHFNWEDATFLGDATKVLTSGNLKYVFIPWYGGYARILWQFISVIFFNFFGYNATPFFVLILVLHLSNIILTYILAIKLTNLKFIAFFSSFLYGIYQINSSSISWISSGIKDIPMTTFFLLSLMFYILFREKGNKRFFIASILFFFLSFSSEFKAILSPFVIIAYDLIFYPQRLSKFKNLVKQFFPYFTIILLLASTFYSSTLRMISSEKNFGFLKTFLASLPVYFLPFSRIFWLKVYSDAHLLTDKLTDEAFLLLLGCILLFIFLTFLLFLKIKKEQEKSKVLLFLLSGIFINYFPVLMTVFTNHHSSWNVITVHWRYFFIDSPLGAILVAALFTWSNNSIYNLGKNIINKLSFLNRIFTLRLLPLVILSTILYLHISSNKILLYGYFLNWTFKAKNIFLTIKQNYPVLPKETVFVIEGTDNETKYPFYQHRYLFENIFALYANPNNPNYLEQQKSLFFNPDEHSDRNLKRILYYTNIKDFLVGNHRHLYKDAENITFISPTIPWGLPAYDRLFLGAIQGNYDPDKIIDFEFDDNGLIKNITEERRKEVKDFLNYFCFDNGVKKCLLKFKKITNPSIVKSMGIFSVEGKQIIEKLINSPLGKIPEIEILELN